MATICCNLVNASSQIALTNKTTSQAGLPSGIGTKSSWPDTQASVSPMAYLLLHTSISIEVCKWVLIDIFGFLILVYFFSQINYVACHFSLFYQVLGRLVDPKKMGLASLLLFPSWIAAVCVDSDHRTNNKSRTLLTLQRTIDAPAHQLCTCN